MQEHLKEQIKDSIVFVCVVKEGGSEGTEGEEMLLYAMHLEKPIIVWMPQDNKSRPFPQILNGRDDLEVSEVRGDHAEMMDKLVEITELKQGESINLISGGYDGDREVSSH